jgi:acyl-coenzyme A thioesterase PaaI-like protein
MPTTVVPAKRLRASHTPCHLVLAPWERPFVYHRRRWLWVPAFAGTTVEGVISAQLKEKDMTDKATEKLKASGWTIVETTGFISLVGPLWQRVVNNEHEYALVAQDKHHNRRGLVQGGVIMTFADRSCGMTARYVSGKPTLATVQMDTHFVEAGKIGEILLSKPHVVRATRSLIFITTEVTVDKRCIAMASGVFKVLKNET